jgi:hypothetical protein
MEANNSYHSDVAGKMKRIFLREADDLLEDPKGLFQQPTAHEVSGLVFGTFIDGLDCAQEKSSNHFAHLLNRGSSLE